MRLRDKITIEDNGGFWGFGIWVKPHIFAVCFLKWSLRFYPNGKYWYITARGGGEDDVIGDV